jgi:hypothetical protein
MTVKDLTLKFITHPANLDMGAGKLAARYNCTRENIYEAKIEARKLLHAAEIADAHEIIKTQEDQLAKYMGSESTPDGTVRKYESSRPLSPKEIEDLVGADGITTTVARVWDKMLPNGKWTYSVDLRYRVKDFYSSDELQDKLKDLMPDFTPVKIQRSSLVPDDQALIILITDDHVGAINSTNLFNAPDMSYKERLLYIIDEALMLGKTFDEIHVVSLGDQMNGWNSQTTRGGHEVTSKTNKEQFDEYTSARVAFYDELFQSGMSQNYFVHDVENSNHTGNGFSYMANQFLDMYLQGKYPQVSRISYHEAIGGFEYGNHVILLGHGKDERFMKKPMPAILDPKTDLYLYDYLSNQRYCPADMNVTFYKGDLHQHGLQNGKFGRYVNVPALSGASDYGDLNYGNTKGGALLEVLDRTSYRISSQAIWFK